MEVRLFGELEALAGGVLVPVRGASERALLALLALQRGQPVSADRLIDLLWGDGQAANPEALQTQIGQLRRTLGRGDPTTPAGYALTARPDEVNVVRFEQPVAKGQRLAADGEIAPAAAALGEALRLRRGEPLAEFTYSRRSFFDAERAHLDELTLVAIESRAGADLALGRHRWGLSPANWRRCAGNTRSARTPVGAAHPRPVPERTETEALCAPTQKSVLVWSTSWASNPDSPCQKSRPAPNPDPSLRAGQRPGGPGSGCRWSPRRRKLATPEILWCRPRCSRRSCMSRGHDAVGAAPRLIERLDRGSRRS